MFSVFCFDINFPMYYRGAYYRGLRVSLSSSPQASIIIANGSAVAALMKAKVNSPSKNLISRSGCDEPEPNTEGDRSSVARAPSPSLADPSSADPSLADPSLMAAEAS